jgi:hypothetical protein
MVIVSSSRTAIGVLLKETTVLRVYDAAREGARQVDVVAAQAHVEVPAARIAASTISAVGRCKAMV